MSRFTLMENLPDLVIASTTTVTMASSYLGKPTRITVGGQQLLYTSLTTLNFATTGLNALDTGTIAANTLYYIYAVQSSGVGGLVASTATPSVGPTGYTAWKEIGRCRTLSSAATLAAIANRVGSTSQGAAVSEWQSYPPTWTSSGTAPALGNGTISGFYRRVGSQMEVSISVLSGTTSTYGTGNYRFSIPSGFTFNLSAMGAAQDPIGSILVSSVSTYYTGTLHYVGTGNLAGLVNGTGGDVGQTIPYTPTASTANQRYELRGSFPIAEWAGLYT